MAFVGIYEHSIDDNGRLVLPAKFRARFTETAGYLTLKGANCVSLMLPDAYEARVQRFTEHVRSRELGPGVLRSFQAMAEEVKPDKQGRFIVPERLRQRCGLRSEVVITGQGAEIEIWDRERWEALGSAPDEELMAALEEGYGI